MVDASIRSNLAFFYIIL